MLLVNLWLCQTWISKSFPFRESCSQILNLYSQELRASTREFVDVVFAYWVIFPDSEQQLINLAQDLVTSDALMEQIKALVYCHPDKLYMETTGGKNKGYRAEMIVVTYCRNRKDIDDKSKFRILLSFGQHGRELITSELALRILSILSGEQFPPNMDPISLNDTCYPFEYVMISSHIDIGAHY
ncbi:hypothetical protein HYC85_011345 [Camellia sinensis]|uniref:Peptidase M14 carboxypeptidase A domain-containing protein n=1 Tax=Camellia sinensis TaxID=4442 RepID=A0A7J7H8T0_CAMSI|nr:hypothetical protein HYC85_011345 [Camellia sinensis]